MIELLPIWVKASIESSNAHVGLVLSVICAKPTFGAFGPLGHGPLGHGGIAYEMVPQLVEGLVGVKVAQGVAGADHTVIGNAEDGVWTFGNGKHGRVGHGGTADKMVP